MDTNKAAEDRRKCTAGATRAGATRACERAGGADVTVILSNVVFADCGSSVIHPENLWNIFRDRCLLVCQVTM